MNTADNDPTAVQQLLLRTGAHDQRAFADLYRCTSGRLFGICLRMLRDPGEAEDALQEVFTTIWRRADRFDPTRAGAITWLATLTRNKAIDRLRQRRDSVLGDPADLDRLMDDRSDPPASAEADEDYVRLLRCMEALDPKDRHSVREAFFSGTTYKELSVRCQVPLGTMKSWIRRALIQLRMCLET